jgi:hypothetical protein
MFMRWWCAGTFSVTMSLEGRDVSMTIETFALILMSILRDITKIVSGVRCDQVKEDVRGRTCNTHREDHIQRFGEKVRIILK